MAAHSQTADSGPVREPARIISLDLIRGVAVLGILLMNAVSFKLGRGPYFNLSAGGSETWLDWAVGFFGEVFIDQKFMGLFSLLFGAGMILFIDRASRRGSRAVVLNLWRNALLLLIGVLHFLLWDGDVLMVYAVSSVFLIGLRKLPNWVLISVGAAVFALSIANALFAQHLANTISASLSGLWEPGEVSDEDPVVGLFLLGYFLRALGLILVGAGLYRTGFMNGGLPARTYRLTAMVGLAVGLPLAAAGVVITAVNDYSRDIAVVGQIPNTLGTIPASLGYMCLIILWNNRADSWLKQRLRAVGRMALTNYLSQTVLGVLVLTVLLGDVDSVNRSAVLVFVFAVWALQVWWVSGVAEPLPVRTHGVALASRYVSKQTAASPPQRLAARSIGSVSYCVTQWLPFRQRRTQRDCRHCQRRTRPCPTSYRRPRGPVPASLLRRRRGQARRGSVSTGRPLLQASPTTPRPRSSIPGWLGASYSFASSVAWVPR